jgi:dienelactone hydrolase
MANGGVFLMVLLAGWLALIASRGADESGGAVKPDTPPQLSFIDYLQRRLASERPLLDFPDDPALVPEWKKQVASRLRSILGVDLSVPAPLNPRLIEVRQRDGYRVEHIVFTSEVGVDVPAFVLIPDGVSPSRPAPAVLCLQGMVPGGKNELTGETEGDPAAEAGIALYRDDFARQFAREGYITLSIDMRYDGERTYHAASDPFGLNERGEANQVAINMATLLGQSFYGFNLFDAQRALDYLESRDDVMHHAIGAAGFSFGSQLSAWLASMDERIKLVALEGNWGSLRRLGIRSFKNNQDAKDGRRMHQMAKSTYQFLPGFLRYLDLHLTIAAVAPTPMVVAFETGRWQYHSKEDADHDIAPIKGAYAAFNKPENLHLVQVTGDHYWRADIIVPWFNDRMREIAAREPAQSRRNVLK